MKYIMYECKVGNIKRLVPIIFPNHLVHKQVAIALKDLVGSSRIVGAGEVSVKVNGVHGKSTTLGIAAKNGHGEIINNYDYSHGLENTLNLFDEVANKIFGDKL